MAKKKTTTTTKVAPAKKSTTKKKAVAKKNIPAKKKVAKKTTTTKKVASAKKSTTTKKAVAKKNTPTKKKIKFEFTGEKGCNVFLAGTFNNWDPQNKQLKEKNGVYSTTISLSKGDYEYKFIIDGNWILDPNCPEVVSNDLGQNSKLKI